uniref:Uncharacterized protein n=1 Tax=Octopus bimaculoides TaxID=37653 RepID=A0A0L8HK65_OCTBM
MHMHVLSQSYSPPHHTHIVIVSLSLSLSLLFMVLCEAIYRFQMVMLICRTINIQSIKIRQ